MIGTGAFLGQGTTGVNAQNRVVSALVEPLPAAVDVVVVGGGIMGASAAYYLSCLGASVLLLEKDGIAAQQSGRNWGFVRKQARELVELPLALRAHELWPGLAEALGADVGWRLRGCLYAAKDDEEAASFERWVASARHFGLDTRVLSPAEVAERVPGLAARSFGGLYTPSDGQAEPGLASRAFAEAARRRGAVIVEGCGVVAIERTAGRITGVATERGQVRAGAVVLAAGATTHRFLSSLGLFLPQQVVRNTVALTGLLPALAEPCFCGLGLGLRQRADGSCIVTDEAVCDIDLSLDTLRAARFFAPSFLKHRASFGFQLGRPFMSDLAARLGGTARSTIEPRSPAVPPNQGRVRAALARFRTLFPQVPDTVQAEKAWAGNIDVLPDAIPVIDAPAAVPGLVVATGFSGHGFGLGPAVGEVVAALATGARPHVSLDGLALARFGAGPVGVASGPI